MLLVIFGFWILGCETAFLFGLLAWQRNTVFYEPQRRRERREKEEMGNFLMRK
jgi:hypothetical protein